LNCLIFPQAKLLPNNSTQRLALLFFILALVEVSFLSSFVPLDAACASWIEEHRSCALDYGDALLSNWPIVTLVTLSVFALLWLCLRRQWTEARQGALMILIGLFLSELLKTGFERARPSVLPPLVTGNSFPSGHATGALLIAGTLGFLLARQHWAAWVKIVGVFILASLVSVVTWQRLYLGHHWLSDVIGSFLLTGAWLCLTLSRPAVLGISWRTARIYAGFLVCYQGFYFFPQTRLVLPSVMSTIGEPLLRLSFGRLDPQVLLYGTWGEDDYEPAGPITWMWHGEASVEVGLPVHQAYILKLAVRPFVQGKTFACFPLEITVNQQPGQRLLLYRGWREYTLRLEPAGLVPGMNLLTFRVGTDFPAATLSQRAVAFRHLLLFAEKQG
jgi:membrane-associated phospholipid phosphatase